MSGQQQTGVGVLSPEQVNDTVLRSRHTGDCSLDGEDWGWCWGCNAERLAASHAALSERLVAEASRADLIESAARTYLRVLDTEGTAEDDDLRAALAAPSPSETDTG